MIAALAGLIGTTAASLLTARQARKAQNEQNQLLRQQDNDNLQNYYASLQSSSLDSPSAVAALTQLRRQTERANGISQNTALSGSLTHDARLASQQRINDTMASATANLLSSQQQQQLQSRNVYAGLHQQYMQQLRDENKNKAQNWMTIGNNMANSLSKIFAV